MPGMTCPRQRSAWSAVMPARDIRERPVRRKSCGVHRSSALPPFALINLLSNAALYFENPLIGTLPFVVNTHGLALMAGMAPSSLCAAFDNGIKCGNFVL